MSSTTREFNFVSGIETPAAPTAGTPTNPDDLVTKSYADATYSGGTTSLDESHVIIGDSTDTKVDVDTDILGDIKASYNTNTVTFDFTGHGDGEDVVLWTAHPLSDGDTVYFTNSGGALPTGISASTLYYVNDAKTNSFNISAYRNGPDVEFTTDGTATSTCHYGGLSARNLTEYQVVKLYQDASANGVLGNLSGTTGNSAFKFTAPDTGVTFKIKVQISGQFTTGATQRQCNVFIKQGSTNLAYLRYRDDVDTNNRGFAYSAETPPFVSDGSDVEFYASYLSGTILGNDTLEESWAVIELLPNHVEVSNW